MQVIVFLGNCILAKPTKLNPRYHRKRSRGTKKVPVVALVQRNGIVKSQVINRVTAKNLKEFIKKNVSKKSVVMTDDFKDYKPLRHEFNHKTIKHSLGQYVQGEVHTNTIEGYFSILKRGINGVFHHVSEKHLYRYLTEFDFRYNMRKVDDEQRTTTVMCNIEKKRLMYREASSPDKAA